MAELKYEYGYNNPALVRENGVLKSYCCRCHKFNGSELDGNWYSLISKRYCDRCRRMIISEQNAARQKNFRRKNRKEKQLIQQQNYLLKQENKLLREAVAALRDDVQKIKGE